MISSVISSDRGVLVKTISNPECITLDLQPSTSQSYCYRQTSTNEKLVRWTLTTTLPDCLRLRVHPSSSSSLSSSFPSHSRLPHHKQDTTSWDALTVPPLTPLESDTMAIKDKIKKVIKKDEPQPSSTQPSSVSTPNSTVPPPAPAKTETKPTTTTKSTPTQAPTSIKMPEKTNGHSAASQGVKTPKTPQDEAISFFSGNADGQPVQVWELWLEDDGAPDEARSVSTRVAQAPPGH